MVSIAVYRVVDVVAGVGAGSILGTKQNQCLVDLDLVRVFAWVIRLVWTDVVMARTGWSPDAG